MHLVFKDRLELSKECQVGEGPLRLCPPSPEGACQLCFALQGTGSEEKLPSHPQGWESQGRCGCPQSGYPAAHCRSWNLWLGIPPPTKHAVGITVPQGHLSERTHRDWAAQMVTGRPVATHALFLAGSFPQLLAQVKAFSYLLFNR